MTYRLECFMGAERGWETLPGYEGLSPFDANFFSGVINRASNTLGRLVRESDGEVFCGRVPE